MTIKNLLALFFAVAFHFSTNGQQTNFAYAEDVDYSPLLQHVSDNLVYPTDARIQGKQGKVLVQFKTDESGVIIDKTVAVITGFFPSCDTEAENIIRSYNNPLSFKNKKIAKSIMLILPINFALTDAVEVKGPPANVNASEDTIEVTSRTAYLSLTSDKESIVLGDCAILTLSFHVTEDNTLPVSFHDLNSQVMPIVNGPMYLQNCSIEELGIREVIAREVLLEGRNTFTYDMYKAKYCPDSVKPIVIPALKLNMMLYQNSPEEKKIGVFTSLPLTIPVKARKS